MPKTEDIVVKDFQNGIADSPYTGFADMRNMDLYSLAGAVRVRVEPGDIGGNDVTDLVKWIVEYPGTDIYYALGDTGRVYTFDVSTGGSWSLVSGNTTTGAHGNGLAIWQDYLFVARDSIIDVYGPLTSGAAWTNGWKTDLPSDTRWHPMVAGQDDILYIGAGRYVSSITELTTFAPGTPATFTWTPQALDLPNGYRIKCMAELGTNLMLGTIVGGSNDLSGEVNKSADIYPWDRSSTTFGLPIKINDHGVHQMQTHNNVLYVTAGFQGAVYRTNGSTTALLRKLPFSITGIEKGAFLNFFPGASAIHDNRYHFAVSQGLTGTAYGGIGVWSVSDAGVLNCEYQISTGTASSANPLSIASLFSYGAEKLFWGFRDNTDYGVDALLGANGYTDYKAYIISPYYHIGTPLNKRTLTQAEITLDRPLTSGEGIRISYRATLNGSFTILGTYDYATYGGIQSFSSNIALVDVDQIQFKIEFDEAGSDRFVLREVRFR